jgi:hypothetical protein
MTKTEGRVTIRDGPAPCSVPLVVFLARSLVNRLRLHAGRVGPPVGHKPTNAQYRALQATARGEAYRTYNSTTYTLTGPCDSKVLWALTRADLIADPPEANKYGRHQMVLTAKGRAAMVSSEFVPGAMMVYRGIEYEIEPIEPGVWKWKCRIGAVIRTGKTKCSLELLADRRVRQRIDQLLRPPQPVRIRRASRGAAGS